jgi:hypothetical protein
MYQQYKQSIDLSTYQPYQHHFSQKKKKKLPTPQRERESLMQQAR